MITSAGPTPVTIKENAPMLTGPTFDKLITLNLGGMARALLE